MQKTNAAFACAFALVLSIPAAAGAQVLITEIMYDLEGADAGREWIEVHNMGDIPVDLTQWRLFENGTNHKITAVEGGEALAPGAYAVIADNPVRFRADWPAFSGQLFDSAFSLSNTGEELVLRDETGADIDAVMYANSMGGNGTGDSLQRDPFPGIPFSAGIPTPGAPIPAGGLTKTPQKEKAPAAKQASAKQKAPSAPAAPVIVGEPEEPVVAEAESQVASAAAVTPAPTSAAPLWWLGVAVIAATGATGVALSRRAKRTEWEIEEIE